MGEVCVRVAVRVRPLLPKEVLHNHQVCVRVVNDGAQVILGSDRTFCFDHAFGPTASQAQVYESCVKPLVASLVDGYNATVFAYGQTGSGKTYTLGGGHIVSLPEEKSGIIGQVATDLFVLLGERSAENIRAVTEVRVSYLELYREELRDLLELHTAHKELHIREDDRGNTVVVGAKEAVTTSAEELLSVLQAGNALRHTGPTQMNERSSRSHAIVTLQLTQHHPDNGSLRCSKLHVVDLAGSERAARTGNTGMRLKDSVHINTGLLALGNVIRALSDPSRRNHVPYRDAKITRLLRDSLGGSAHTLMLACVSPSHNSVTETLSVLQFASRARHVKNRPGLCPARVCQGWDPGDARLGELEQEVQTLREALRERGKTVERVAVTDCSKQVTRKVCDNRELDSVEELQYRRLAQEAALLLEELQSSSLNAALQRRLQDWLERHEQLSRSSHTHRQRPVEDASDRPHHITILQLRRELKKCQDALAVDKQEIDRMEAGLQHLQKQAQAMLQERQTLLQSLEDEREHRRIQNEHLVEQQLLIDRLRGDLLTFRLGPSGPLLETRVSGKSARRPHSVPLISQGQDHGSTRKIHTSPPACSLERVMAAFKTRNQLLLAQIEERDEVICPQRAQEEENGEQRGSRHPMNRTWTSRQEPAGLGQNWGQNTSLDQFPQPSDFPTAGRMEHREGQTPMGNLQCQRQVEAPCRTSLQTHGTQEPRTDKVTVFHNGACKDSEEKLSERRVWLEQEEERALQRRSCLQELEEELRHREEVLQHREACFQERNQLQIKRLRSSQALSQDLVQVSSRLGALDQELEERKAIDGAPCSSAVRQCEVSVEELLKERESLCHRRDTLDKQLRDGRLLRPEEEHALLHLEEALEALDAAVEFKNRSIQERQRDLLDTSNPDDGHDVTRALTELSFPEASALLIKYFNKVVCLREAEHRLRLRCEELQLQSGEQEAMIGELEAAIQCLTADTERQLTEQRREHQHRIQLLLQQLPEGNSGDSDQVVQARLQQLERDLFFYKSSSRELKRKLRQLITESLPTQGPGLETRGNKAPDRAGQAPGLETRGNKAPDRAGQAPGLETRGNKAPDRAGQAPGLETRGNKAPDRAGQAPGLETRGNKAPDRAGQAPGLETRGNKAPDRAGQAPGLETRDNKAPDRAEEAPGMETRDHKAPDRAGEAPGLETRDNKAPDRAGQAPDRAGEAPSLETRDNKAPDRAGEAPGLRAPRGELTRLSRKELRQISPSELHNTRGRSALKASRGSFQQDSIEMPRNTD
ncbi:kinesin-like protein KIF27 isoform X2 [Esox lucius]|uniref:Kinesin motor domain-containing protein n=1 Tax=Esox lucius TaxID=8010 RepID=A0A3P8ZEG5_ESOLU|nr:kinesin-like protein KIF27 isoform X2 [Esox lucius]